VLANAKTKHVLSESSPYSERENRIRQHYHYEGVFAYPPAHEYTVSGGYAKTPILGSGAMTLVWSASAAKSQWLQRFINFAQHLQKQIVPVVIDGTSLDER
jgi:hypothetical protein